MIYRTVAAIALVGVCFMGSAPSATAQGVDLQALSNAVGQMCVQPDKKGSYLRIDGDLNAGATLRVVGVTGGAKVTKEEWNGINQRIDQYRTDPRQCAIETLKLLVPLYSTRPHSGLDIEHTQHLLASTIEELSHGHLDNSRYSPMLRQQLMVQLAVIKQWLSLAGGSQSLKYISTETEPPGFDEMHFADYRQKANFQWDIVTDNDGTILGLHFHLIP